MTPIEAYFFALDKVEELKKEGIRIIIRPRKKVSKVEVEEGCQIPFKNWVDIDFKDLDKQATFKILEMAKYLGLAGIRFDTFGCCSNRTWEFDWSFEYEKGNEQEQWRDALEDMEDGIDEAEELIV